MDEEKEGGGEAAPPTLTLLPAVEKGQKARKEEAQAPRPPSVTAPTVAPPRDPLRALPRTAPAAAAR